MALLSINAVQMTAMGRFQPVTIEGFWTEISPLSDGLIIFRRNFFNFI